MDEEAGSLLNRVYRSLRRPIKDPQVTYRITCEKTSNRFLIERNGSSSDIARDASEFLYKFEKDLTIQTQKLRRDLYFLHAATLELNCQALALVAPSGGGKSTMTWGLLHHGFKYLSDELAPIDLTTLRVHRFPQPSASNRCRPLTILCQTRRFLLSGRCTCPLSAFRPKQLRICGR